MALVDEIRAARRLPPPEVARAIRHAAGASQARCAAEIGVHRVTLARWELGQRRPNGRHREAYAELLTSLEGLA